MKIKRSEDFSEWYTSLVLEAGLADYAPVKGCMVIKPYGYAIWELMQSKLDSMISETGHVNAYFPLFIPESFLAKEKEHVEGFAPEVAVVTHAGGKKLEEPLIVRPTSETIIYSMYSKWIRSWRDLPILINQWANIVRWEMRTRLFLRTTEFLWQEGHTAHATHEEADVEAKKMLDVYQEFSEKTLAIPVIKGEKSELQRFAGALSTYCIEAIMQDGKALQMGTSHDLGQNFSKPFNIAYQTKEGSLENVWQTSWGVSTRLIGSVVMAHGDDKGLVIPPAIAPYQIVIVPIWKSEEEKQKVTASVESLARSLKQKFRIYVDNREQYTPGWKFNEWELKGVPLRIEIGPKDIANKKVVLARRDNFEKLNITQDAAQEKISEILDDIQVSLFNRIKTFQDSHTSSVKSYEEFKAKLENPGGFIIADWCGERSCEEKIQTETKATIRCIPFTVTKENNNCLHCGKPSISKVYFAKAY